MVSLHMKTRGSPGPGPIPVLVMIVLSLCIKNYIKDGQKREQIDELTYQIMLLAQTICHPTYYQCNDTMMAGTRPVVDFGPSRTNTLDPSMLLCMCTDTRRLCS